jgi:uncharacterized protein (DUF1330 family)
MPPSFATLDKYELGVLPGPISMARVLARPNERFVMVNLLVFKDEATKPYEGMTGREAYQKYVETVEKIQGPMGSTLLWNGDVTDQLVGDSEPRFEVAALLKYASPRAFAKFALTSDADTKARKAGLLGQWLLACTTERYEPAPPGGVGLFELLGAGDDGWRAEWEHAIEAHGGQTVWVGRADQHVIGAAAPAVERVVLHWFADDAAVQRLMSSDAVASIRRQAQVPRPWWVFSVRTGELLKGLQ